MWRVRPLTNERKRAELAADQEALVRALTEDRLPPEGFDPARIAANAASLRMKRLREVIDCWPELMRDAATRDRFMVYAKTAPLPAFGGPLADGRAFAVALDQRTLSTGARLEILRVDLRWRRTPEGLLRRRGFSLQLRFFHRRLVVAVHLPDGTELWRA